MKRKTSLFQKLLLGINSIFSTLLLLSYILPYISPKNVPIIAVISLFVPFLIIINCGFVVYWLINLKKHFMSSAIVLAIGWLVSVPFYKFSERKVLLADDLKVMSYNVRLFNHYNWNKDKNIASKIEDFINEKSPDILAIQEYYGHKDVHLNYNYKYIKLKSSSNKFGAAIFSKYPIINQGSLDFKESANNAIFVDIIKQKDTIRVYNVHLQSLKINPEKENFGEENSDKLLHRLKTAFKKQAIQIQGFLNHEQNWKGKKIICTDLNNTAYSWVYKQISEDKIDTFLEAGKGFGKTFNYTFPARIDMIFTDDKASINHFKTFNHKYSDHFPIMAHLNWSNL